MPANTITPKNLAALDATTYLLVDVRDESAYQLGHIDHSIRIDREELLALAENEALTTNDLNSDNIYKNTSPSDVTSNADAKDSSRADATESTIDHSALQQLTDAIAASKKLVFYCMFGVLSKDVADAFADRGCDAYNIDGGYGSWLVDVIEKDSENEERRGQIEQSLRKKFQKNITSRFVKAISNYELIQPGDRVAVCISGGKDSMIMAKLFQEIKRRNKFPFEVVFLCMNPGYSETTLGMIENNAKLLGIPLTMFETHIFDAVDHIENSPCYICARMRRGHLYHKAKELGCNKIALGHHYDDVIETTLMSMLYSGQIQTMMPKLHSTNFEGMELIRPLYLIREDDIKAWRDYNGLQFIRCACHFTDTCSVEGHGDSNSKRLEAKRLIRELKKNNPNIEGNIFRSMSNVMLNTVLEYKQDGERHSFLDTYENNQNLNE